MITEADIFIDNLESKDKVLERLAQKAFERKIVEDSNELYRQLCMREEEFSTGFGNGLAIPHAKHECIEDASILILRNHQSVEWGSIDGEPVNLCICLLVPDGHNDLHISLLSKLSRKLMHEDFVELLHTAEVSQLVKEINSLLN